MCSDGKTFASAIISFLGSGVLGFPFAFKQTGILVRAHLLCDSLMVTISSLCMYAAVCVYYQLGLLLLLLVGAVSTFCMLLVVECKYRLRQRGVHVTTYGEIGHAALGKTGQVLVNVALVVAQTGFGVACEFFYHPSIHYQ